MLSELVFSIMGFCFDFLHLSNLMKIHNNIIELSNFVDDGGFKMIEIQMLQMLQCKSLQQNWIESIGPTLLCYVASN